MKKTAIKMITAAFASLALLGACGSGGSAASSGSDGAGASTSDVLAKIKDAGELKVGTEAQYAPYEFKDAQANFAGADIALAQQIADDLGVKLTVTDMKFDGIIPAVQSGQVDLGIAAFSNTAERAKVIDFSDIYEKSEQMLVVAAENAGKYTSVESLAGQKVGAQKGTIQSDLVRSELTDSELFELDKYPALALEIKNGNIAGLVADAAVGQGLIDTSNGALAAADFSFTGENANVGKAVVLAKGNDALKAEVNKTIKKMMDDGSYQKAYDEAVALAQTLGLEVGE
ncbi:MAG: transporter substrate-binding domain-containing protein [Actinomycetaceae bacterium]|nr:transporter substrate-binding domain-containing protein [Arcanobacterium sp.]MDD7504795.1 transporter substrate-binding domain-containing protein [Actinomycetaceae bacterium]MDY6142676.1 transporter substrate-binding domain-containing protein [Arcanobacterium sp.]